MVLNSIRTIDSTMCPRRGSRSYVRSPSYNTTVWEEIAVVRAEVAAYCLRCVAGDCKVDGTKKQLSYVMTTKKTSVSLDTVRRANQRIVQKGESSWASVRRDSSSGKFSPGLTRPSSEIQKVREAASKSLRPSAKKK